MIYRVLLFLYGCNIYRCANYIAVGLCAILIWKNRGVLRWKHSRFLYLTVIASVAYGIIYSMNYGSMGSSELFMRVLAPVLFSWLGLERARKGFECIVNDVITIGFGESVHGFLNIITNRNTRILDIQGRAYNDIWGETISAIGQNLFYIIPCSLLFYFIFCEKRKKVKLFGTSAAIVGVYGTITNASRTLLILLVMCFLISTMLYVWNYKNTIRSFKMVFFGLILLVLGVAFFTLDIFGLQTTFNNSALGQRMLRGSSGSSIAENLRWVYAGEILTLLPKYPFGNVPTLHYAHNLWMDIAKETGVIPFMLYIALVMISVENTAEFCKRQIATLQERLIIIPMTVVYFMVFFVEPILIGSPMTFAIFCYLSAGGEAILKARHTRPVIANQ